MFDLIEKYIQNRRILILGFGREGKSTCRYLLRHFQGVDFSIADKNPLACEGFDFGGRTPQIISGEHYLEAIADFDVIIKSPGIRLDAKACLQSGKILLSQTGLFLEQYGQKIIGVTGTKGKSTTASLIHHILLNAGKKSLLVGNIGIPPFDVIEFLDDHTVVVFELSANQLQCVNHSPHIAVLLNLFEEHLDFFGTPADYYLAKMNITFHQDSCDYFICNKANSNIKALLQDGDTKAQIVPISVDEALMEGNDPTKHSTWQQTDNTWNGHLQGDHNLLNISAATIACKLAGIGPSDIAAAIHSFKPLEHRLEFVGNFCGIDFYNDSISTIPQSTIEAVKTVKNTHTLILGGFDRGLDYCGLFDFLKDSGVERFIFTGPAGFRMMHLMAEKKRCDQELVFIEHFQLLKDQIGKTKTGYACLLSPAASSYNEFKDFAERGRVFKKIAENLKDFCH